VSKLSKFFIFFCSISIMKEEEQESFIAELQDAVTSLCQKRLTFEEQVQVQGLLCITVDKQEVLVDVPLHDRLGQAALEPCVACGRAKEQNQSTPENRRQRKRRRRSSSGSESSCIDSDNDPLSGDIQVKIEEIEPSDDESGGLILTSEDIKVEDNVVSSVQDTCTLSAADNSTESVLVNNSQHPVITIQQKNLPLASLSLRPDASITAATTCQNVRALQVEKKEDKKNN
jgi:hypothetical protein